MNANPRFSFIVLQSATKIGDKVVGAEVGVYEGVNSYTMLALEKNLELYCIDSYTNVHQDDTYVMFDNVEALKEIASTRLRKFGDRVHIIHKNSEEAFRDFSDEFFDYVYIDGDHSYEAVMRDCQVWWPKVKKGGLLAGHDIGMQSVKSGVREFCREIGRRAGVYEFQGEADWWIIK